MSTHTIIQDILDTGMYSEQDIADYAGVSKVTIQRIKTEKTKKTNCRTLNNIMCLYLSLQQQLEHQSIAAKDKNLKILIVEDVPLIQEAYVMLLQQLGYSADVAKNGKEALECSTQKVYDIILMDIGLPDISGIKVTEKIRRSVNFTKKNCLIIALTAHVIDEILDDCLAAGIDIVENKPICLEKLRKIIYYTIHRKTLKKD